MRAGTERLAGVNHELERVLADAGITPGRAHVQRGYRLRACHLGTVAGAVAAATTLDQHGLVKLPPAVRPIVGHVCG
jgi:hypothetical protein